MFIITPWGYLVYCVCFLFVRLRISQRRKKIAAWNFASCSTTILNELLPFWWTLARVESRRRHYFRDELNIEPGGEARWAVGIGRRDSVGSLNWGAAPSRKAVWWDLRLASLLTHLLYCYPLANVLFHAICTTNHITLLQALLPIDLRRPI